MKNSIEKKINIENKDLVIKGIDDGISYVVNVFYKKYYIPPSYSYNYTNFENMIHSYESGLFYGTLEEIITDFVKIIKTDPFLKKKLKIIDDYLKS